MKFNIIRSGSSANLYTVKSDTSIIIEAGLSGVALKKSLNYMISSYSGALFSHSHLDHFKGCKDIINSGVNCYMSKETAKKLNFNHHRIKIVNPLQQFYIGDWVILPFPTQHDCPGSMGYLIENNGEKLVFITDSYYCKYKFKNLTHICIECNWSSKTLSTNINIDLKKRLEYSHFNLDRVVDFLNSNNLDMVREIYLLHISKNNGDPELFKKTIQQLTGKQVFV